MGDGNFHLQLRSLCKTIEDDPSIYGDTGFWALRKMYKEYTEAGGALPIKEPKVCSDCHVPSYLR
jgi:hypothetical protein